MSMGVPRPGGLAAALLVASVAWPGGGVAARVSAPAIVDVTVAAGVGTTLPDVFGDGTGVPVRTSVRSVTYESPRRIGDGPWGAYEVSGSVQGIGWGGQYQAPDGGAILDATSHYTYDIPFVLRWHQAWSGVLVYYSHGYTPLPVLRLADGILGEANEGRYLEQEGEFVSGAALAPRRRHAFFAPNLGGLTRSGTASIVGIDAPFSGQPLSAAHDAVTTRDLADVAQRLLAKLTFRVPVRTIGTGYSAGALVMQFLNGGVSTILNRDRFGAALMTGGNYRAPYDPSSGLLFDAVIPLAGSDVRVDAARPMAAPMLMIGGQAEFAGLNMVLYAQRLKAAGVRVDDRLRIYQVRNLPHAWADVVASTPNINRQVLERQFGVTRRGEGDFLMPVVAAVLDASLAWLDYGLRPPASRIEGTAVDRDRDGVADALAFATARGGVSQLLPVVDDPSIDTVEGQIDTANLRSAVVRYAEVLSSLEHEPEALSLPGTTCRLGGFTISSALSDAALVPFFDISARWPNAGLYQACLTRRAAELQKTNLYDPAFAPNLLWARLVFDHLP